MCELSRLLLAVWERVGRGSVPHVSAEGDGVSLRQQEVSGRPAEPRDGAPEPRHPALQLPTARYVVGVAVGVHCGGGTRSLRTHTLTHAHTDLYGWSLLLAISRP